MKNMLIPACLMLAMPALGQNNLTPETLLQMSRVSGLGISKNKEFVLYSVSTPDIAQNKLIRKNYYMPVDGGDPVELKNPDSLLDNDKISPDGMYILQIDTVKIKKIYGVD